MISFDQLIKYMSSKAAQLLRALNGQINHSAVPLNHPLQAINEERVSKNEGAYQESGNRYEEVSFQVENVAPINDYNQKMKYEENKEAPECLTEILEKQVGSLLSSTVIQTIQSVLRQREKNAYDSFTKGQNEYLQVLLDQAKKRQGSHFDVFDKETQVITGLISKRQEKVEDDLDEGRLLVNYERKLTNRKQLQKLQKIDQARMIKIKDGEIRSKMDILKQKMQKFSNIESWELQDDKKIEQEIQRKLLENMDANNYSLDSQKTKIAKDYVKYMQQQRKEFQRRRKQRLFRVEQHEKEREADLKEAEEMRDLAKRQQILQKIQIRKKKREQQEKQQQAQQEAAKKIIQQYHKKLPIFKIKEKQFEERILKPEQKYRQEKLNQIRENRRSLSLNQIKKHEQSYISKLQIQSMKRKQQLKLLLRSQDSQDKRKKYYKGSAHARIEEMTKEDVLRNFSLRQASKIKANRMKQYSQVISKHHQPLVDEQKRKQLVKLIEENVMKKKRAKKIFRQVVDQKTNSIRFESYYEQIPEKDIYKQGNKMFEEAKKWIKKKQHQSEKNDKNSTENANNEDNKIKLLSNSKVESQKRNRSLWQIRAKKLQQMANSQVTDAKNFENLKQNIYNLDTKAAQKQQLLKQVDLSIDEHINQKGMLDNYYLQSIKQKMKLLQ